MKKPFGEWIGINPWAKTQVFCKKCGSNLTNRRQFGGYYSCKVCDSWTAYVEVKQMPLINTDVA